jgi:hypothetical protein
MTDFFENLLAETFREEGEEPTRAAKLAKMAWATVKASGMVRPSVMDGFELDAKIYKLRGMGLSEPVIRERLGVKEQRIYEALRRYLKRRRGMLQARSEWEEPQEPLAKVG